VLRYCDGQTDDALLTRSVMASAQKLGAELALPATFVDAQLIDEGVDVRCTHRGRPEHLRARVSSMRPDRGRIRLRRASRRPRCCPRWNSLQGTHLIVPGELAQGHYYVESPRDGRAVFVMPWYGQILIGTTETRYRGNPDQVAPLAAGTALPVVDPQALLSGACFTRRSRPITRPSPGCACCRSARAMHFTGRARLC